MAFVLTWILTFGFLMWVCSVLYVPIFWLIVFPTLAIIGGLILFYIDFNINRKEYRARKRRSIRIDRKYQKLKRDKIL